MAALVEMVMVGLKLQLGLRGGVLICAMPAWSRRLLSAANQFRPVNLMLLPRLSGWGLNGATVGAQNLAETAFGGGDATNAATCFARAKRVENLCHLRIPPEERSRQVKPDGVFHLARQETKKKSLKK